jgi:hypothetical protein
MEVFGPQKKTSTGSIRVDNIEILERGSGQQFGGMCKDGFVYNFEVEENNNYFVEGILVHNCHHSTATTYQNILRHFGVLKGEEKYKHIVLLGVTATPSRADHVGLDKIFDEIAFNYGLREGINNGYLSNIKAYQVTTGTDLTGVHTRMGDFAEDELAEAVNDQERNKLIISTYKEITPDTKALVFAANVAHAKNLSDDFNSAGIKSAYILGETSREERHDILRKFKTGDIKVVTNCQVLTEGFNEPSIQTLLMARPTKSSVLYQQMVGRGTRLFEGKPWLNLVDFVDNVGKNKIATLPTLFGCNATLKGTKGKLITEVMEKVEKLQESNPDYDLERVTSWDDEEIEKVVKEVNIFAQAELPPEVKTNSEFSWTKHDDNYKIEIPPKDDMKFTVTIYPNMLNKFDVIASPFKKVPATRANGYSGWQKTKGVKVGQGKDIEAGFRVADEYIKENFGDRTLVLSQEGKWRKDPATDKQLAMLKRLHIPVPNGISKGQCAVLISKAMMAKKT